MTHAIREGDALTLKRWPIHAILQSEPSLTGSSL